MCGANIVAAQAVGKAEGYLFQSAREGEKVVVEIYSD